MSETMDVRHQMFKFAYGHEADGTDSAMLAAYVPAEQTPMALRAMIAAFDRQSHPTPISVRFDGSELISREWNGIKLWLDRADVAVSTEILLKGSYEPHMTSFVREHVHEGMTVVDIGANIGIFTMLAASQGAKVLAFEPNTENCRLILLNKEANGFDSVMLYPVALSNKSGALFFSPHMGSNGGVLPNQIETLSNPNCIVVPAMRLDDLIAGPVHFIKADIEGAEYLALKGGERIIREHKPIITIELSMEMAKRVSDIDGIEFIRWILSFGYRGFVMGRTGQKSEIVNLDAFAKEWGNPLRIEDLAFLPT